MSGSVSVPGPGGSTITQTFSNAFNNALAKSIADALANAANTGELRVRSYDGTGAIPTPVSGKTNELVLDLPANSIVTVPAGYAYLIDNSPGPDTIYGNPGLSIMGGLGSHTIIDPAVIALGDSNTVTVTGVGDNVAVGNGTNVITGTGSGTLSGGTGNDTFIEKGGASYLINSNGFGDTIRAADGGTTVNSSGPLASIVGGGGSLTASVSGGTSSTTGSLVVGGGGLLTVTVTGAYDSVSAGRAAADVTLSGSNASVKGSTAELSVLDSGVGDTVYAGVSLTSVTATGGAHVVGSSGPLNFVGGSGPSTIVGGSGDATVFGGTGPTSIFGGAGSAFTYVNSVAGGLYYVAGSGSETIDASLSKGQGVSSVIIGGADSAGHNLLIAGQGQQYLFSGSGSDTLVGGNGINTFYFNTASGGPSSNDFISNFSAIDVVVLQNYGPQAAAAAIAGATTTGNSTTITLSDATKITFVGVTSAAALNDHIVST
jgi:hypothetical protein